MKRFAAIFVVLVAILSVGLYIGLRRQQLEVERPSGGSATVEGVEVAVVSRLAARVTAVKVEEGAQVEPGQILVELECIEPRAMLAEAESAVRAGEVGIELAEGGVELARVGVDTAKRQTRAAGQQASATRAQRAVLAVQREAAERELARISQLVDSGATTEQSLDRAKTAVSTLGNQESAVGSQTRAALAQKDVVAQKVIGSSLQVRLAEARVKAAREVLERAKAARTRALAAVGECSLSSPIAGVVQTRAYEPGEVVLPGTRVLTVVNTTEARATFYLPSAELAAVRAGSPVEAVADAYPGEVFAGHVRRVGVEAEFTPRNVQTREDRDRLVYAVDVAIPNADRRLRPGMAVEVTLPTVGRGD